MPMNTDFDQNDRFADRNGYIDLEPTSAWKIAVGDKYKNLVLICSLVDVKNSDCQMVVL